MTLRNVFFVDVDIISLPIAISKPKIFLLRFASKTVANIQFAFFDFWRREAHSEVNFGASEGWGFL